MRGARRTWIAGAALGLALGCSGWPGPGAERADGAAAWRAEGRRAVDAARAETPAPRPARNVVLFVGDGMGVSTVTAARILAGQLRGEPGEEGWLAFERLPHTALVKTYNTNQQVADSAGTATALLTGVKTRAGVLNLDASAVRGEPWAPARELPTLFEQAEARGLATGVVTTTRITHATPAAAYAHTSERGWESDAQVPEEARAAGVRDIAVQLVEFAAGDGLEVMLGGGREMFLPGDAPDPEYPDQRGARADGRDLVAEWLAAAPGRHYAWRADQLAALDPAAARQLLGLFEPAHMQWEALRAGDAAGEPSLAELTRAALARLERSEPGYLLLVEGGRIDHGHHASSAYLALHDTIALSEAVAAALEVVDLAETLLVVTADHSHVFTIAGYPTRGNPILGLVRTNDERGEPQSEPALDASGLPYTTLGYHNGPGHPGASPTQPEGAKHFPHFPGQVRGVTAGRPDLSELDTEDPLYLQESAVPLIGETHAGEDVPLYAGGAGSELFRGVREQSWVYHAIVEALGWRE